MRAFRVTAASAFVRRLRPDEALLVAGAVASAAVTVYAHVDLARLHVDAWSILVGLLRLLVVAALAPALPRLQRALGRGGGRPRLAAAAAFVEAMLPFLMCIAIYTNLHDSVRLVNPRDFSPELAAAEGWLFGGQPVVWAERAASPAWTEIFNFFYATFYLIAPSVVIVLWAAGRRAEARRVLVGVILCFYSGFVLYVIVPASPPRLYLASLGAFHVALGGGPVTAFENALVGMMPNRAAGAAFPSLHAAVSALSLYYAWRCCRRFFPVLLVFVTGMLAATVYLRHHYVVDLLAGALMLPWVLWVTPRFERWWARRAVTS